MEAVIRGVVAIFASMLVIIAVDKIMKWWNRGKAEKEEQLLELQFWRDDQSDEIWISRTDIHFPTMLMYRHSVYLVEPLTIERLEDVLYHVRRRGDGMWEEKISSVSFAMEVRLWKKGIASLKSEELRKPHYGITRTHDFRFYEKEFDEWLKDNDEQWKPLFGEGSPTAAQVETAYQRFIHAQGVPVVDPGWEAMEEREWKRLEENK